MINIHDNQKYKKKINFYSVSYNIILKYQNISHQCDFFYNWSKRTIVIDVFLFFLTDKINGLRLPLYKIEEFFIAHTTFSEENNRPFFRALFYIEKIKSSLYFLLIS